MKPPVLVWFCRPMLLGCFALTMAFYGKAQEIAFEYDTLENGLKIILLPGNQGSFVSVTVMYGVGSRQDPANQSGMAHLLEHQLFQGSAQFDVASWDNLTRQPGCYYNGFTSADFTSFYTRVPFRLLETVIQMEADRMRTPRFDEPSFATQKSSVKRECLTTINNRPYGGFPWLTIQPFVFQNINNAKNSYNNPEETDAILLPELKDFHKAYYHPNNAVIVILGNGNMPQTKEWITRYFGKIPPSTLPAHASVEEPRQQAAKRIEKYDPLISLPAMAIAYKMPGKNSPAYYALCIIGYWLLKENGGLFQKQFDHLKMEGVKINGGIHYLGNILNYKDPMVWMTDLIIPANLKPDSILSLFDQAIDSLSHSITQERIRSAMTSLLANLFKELGRRDSIPLAETLAFLALFEGGPQKINELENAFKVVNSSLVQKTLVEFLHPRNRTMLLLKPTGWKH